MKTCLIIFIFVSSNAAHTTTQRPDPTTLGPGCYEYLRCLHEDGLIETLNGYYSPFDCFTKCDMSSSCTFFTHIDNLDESYSCKLYEESCKSLYRCDNCISGYAISGHGCDHAPTFAPTTPKPTTPEPATESTTPKPTTKLKTEPSTPEPTTPEPTTRETSTRRPTTKPSTPPTRPEPTTPTRFTWPTSTWSPTESTTPPDWPKVCYEKGECLFSNLLDVTHATSAERCLQDCKTTDGCQWFTYKEHDGSVCELFESCEYFSNDDCDNCISGQVSCSESECNSKGVSGRCQVHFSLIFIQAGTEIGD